MTPCYQCGRTYSARQDLCPECGTASRVKGRARSLRADSLPGFRLQRKIGSGGMGVVFLATDLAHDRTVAVKVLRPHLSRDTSYLVRFVEEVRVLSSLKHDSIVEVYGRGREGNLVYLTMEYVDGPSARDAVRDQGHLPWREVARITWGAAMGLNVAHQQAGVVHGDVKPGNFLLTRGGRVKLCDFGLARVDLKGRPSKDRAAENERRGTAAYAAPERFLATPATIQGDIYSLGVSLFQMATGELPFEDRSVVALKDAHLNRAIPLLRSRKEGINPALQMLLERMMAKDPKQRYASYPALISDLSLLVEA